MKYPLSLRNVEDLLVMDAMDLKFPDASFDAVIGPYVLTVVPEPERTLDEMARVVKPGESYLVKAGTPHAAHNAGTVGYVGVANYIVESDKPLSTPVK